MNQPSTEEKQGLTKEQKIAFDVMQAAKIGFLADRVPAAGYASPVLFPSRHRELSMERVEDKDEYNKLYPWFRTALGWKNVGSGSYNSDTSKAAEIGFTKVSEVDAVLRLSLPLNKQARDKGRDSEIIYALVVPNEKAQELRDQLEKGDLDPAIVYELAHQFHAKYRLARGSYSDDSFSNPKSLYLLPLAQYPKPSKVAFSPEFDPNKIVKLAVPLATS